MLKPRLQQPARAEESRARWAGWPPGIRLPQHRSICFKYMEPRKRKEVSSASLSPLKQPWCSRVLSALLPQGGQSTAVTWGPCYSTCDKSLTPMQWVLNGVRTGPLGLHTEKLSAYWKWTSSRINARSWLFLTHPKLALLVVQVSTRLNRGIPMPCCKSYVEWHLGFAPAFLSTALLPKGRLTSTKLLPQALQMQEGGGQGWLQYSQNGRGPAQRCSEPHRPFSPSQRSTTNIYWHRELAIFVPLHG